MRDKVVNNIIIKIKENNKELDDIKLAEIKYGLQGIYTIVTKTITIFLLAVLLNLTKQFIIFLIFYSLLRGFGYGTHAKSNLQCWIFSIVLILGIPILSIHLNLTFNIKLLLWGIFFINFLIFSPADTRKRPMINKKRKINFKIVVLLISVIYLFLIINFKNISNLILGAMFLEGLLVNPLGYVLMGEEVRFRLNDINIFKLN